jgi:hypothetical protein
VIVAARAGPEGSGREPLAVVASPADDAVMTHEDFLAREAIRYTLASYNLAGDGNDAAGYAAVFTEDGVLESADFHLVGRGQIEAWKAARIKAPPPAKFVRHNLTTSRIDLTGPERAEGRTYFVVFTEVGPDHSGYYTDVFRKVGEQWLIAHRKVWLDWRAHDSRFRPQRAES